MPAMSRVEAVFCRSAPWRFVARRVVLPWALQGVTPSGDVLEIGAGSGAMAAELLATHTDIHMTVTDFDREMVDAAHDRLAAFADRVHVREVDATELPFENDSFDVVLSWIMLHHTLDWERTLTEAVRVTRPGGYVIGYDLLNTATLRLLHQAEGSRVRMMRFVELRNLVATLAVEQAILTPATAGVAVRFLLRVSGATST